MQQTKTILIIGGDNGGGSAGDGLMCEAACAFFQKRGFKVYTDAQYLSWRSPIDEVITVMQLRKDCYRNKLERILKSVLKLYRLLLLPFFIKSEGNIPFFLHGNDFKVLLQKCDFILFAGCGGLTDKYIVNVLMWWSIVKSAKIMNKPVYVSGVGIGPIHSLICKEMIKYIVDNVAYITVRDYVNSYRWIRQLAHNQNYDWVPDDACFYTGRDTYQITKKKDRKVIGISLMSSLFKNEDQFLSVCQYLKYIFSEYYDCTLYLLAITHEDHKILSVVSQLIENSIIVPLLSPSATKNIVSQLDMLITSRYHGCVFGASQGIPTIGLYSEEYWKNKNMGVLEMFGCKNAVFSICDIQSSNMEDKISEFLLTPDFIRHEMKQKKSVLMKKSYFVHNKIFEIYENTLG